MGMDTHTIITTTAIRMVMGITTATRDTFTPICMEQAIGSRPTNFRRS